MLMNAQQVYTTVTQWLHVQILMDHSHVNVKMVTLEMDKLVQVRMKRLQNICARRSKTFLKWSFKQIQFDANLILIIH